jgi:hypothetical protein
LEILGLNKYPSKIPFKKRVIKILYDHTPRYFIFQDYPDFLVLQSAKKASQSNLYGKLSAYAISLRSNDGGQKATVEGTRLFSQILFE